MVFSVISLVLSFVVLVYAVHLAIVFQRFNDGIKAWAENLDNSTKAAIDRSARQLLIELDKKITESNLNDQTDFENVDPKNL